MRNSGVSYHVKSYAKVNLSLYINGRDDRGYHLLQSYFYPVKFLYDDIIIKKVEGEASLAKPQKDYVKVRAAPYIGNILDTIVHKTIAMMRDKYNIKQRFDIEICKQIPVGSGLGGGSSNGSAVITGINNLCSLKLSKREMCDIAKTIGADMPFFIHNKPAIVEGFGDVITPLQHDDKYHILIATPQINISTQSIFTKYAASVPQYSELKAHNDLRRQIGYNDLQPVVEAEYPKISEVVCAISNCTGCMHATMSGTGSSCFGVFTDISQLQSAVMQLQYLLPDCHIFYDQDAIETA